MMIIGFMVAAALQAGVGRSAPAPRTAQAARPAPTVTHASARPVRNAIRVVIDAGHGGPDVGAPMRLRAKIYEKDIALQVALKVGAGLKRHGIDVVYTRAKDTLIALADRGRIANDAGGNLFISIHVNAANPGWRDAGAARGFETYFLGVAKTEDAQRVESMEEESIRFEGNTDVSRGDPLAFILSDMKQNEHLRESSDFAEIVQQHLKIVHPGPNRGVKQANFSVLLNAFMPAVLVEIGFGTNADEAQFLASQVKQREIADAIVDATREYLDRYERRVGSGTESGGR